MVLDELHQGSSEIRRETRQLREHVEQHNAQLGRVRRSKAVRAEVGQVLGDESEVP